MYETSASFDRNIYFIIREARICYFEIINLVLKKKRQSVEIKVRYVMSESAKWEKYDKIMNEV